ncbi:MAG TPA: efflux RND transporter permease subunit, partial [Algoriphagus sp.]|nr:efflux RND transporter permease subunit [Algoriphagus sp.]
LIDNAIIVLDNITRKRESGLPLFEACVQGSNEVMGALISSVLTTLAVFVPLVFLSGISGALFYDQAVAVGAILSVSLLVAFVLLPLLYWMIFRVGKRDSLKGEPKAFLRTLRIYERGFDWVFARKKAALVGFMVLIPLGLSLGFLLKSEGLPEIEKPDATLEIDWNEPISVAQNRDRLIGLIREVEGYSQAEADVGVRQFLLFDGDNSLQRSLLYLLFPSENKKDEQLEILRSRLQKDFPLATFTLGDAPNAFDQLFNSNMPYYEVRWKDLNAKKPIEAQKMKPWLEDFPAENWEPGPGLQEESSVVFSLLADKLSLYQIPVENVQEQLSRLFGVFTITDIRRFGEITPIRLRENQERFEDLLRNTRVYASDSTSYLLREFVDFRYADQYKYVTADRGGIFQSAAVTSENPDAQAAEFIKWGVDKNLAVETKGQFFRDQENIRQLIGILLISVLLLYFILAAQFESFWQPLIVVFTLPLGISGAFLVLLIFGATLNVMSAIGLVVMLGIMVNDAILKIDTINNLKAEFSAEQSLSGAKLLDKAIHEAGKIRLKPILMTSITTILALIPIIFSSGLGADLQRPLVFAVIGGLTIGTITALYFVPLMYWFFDSQFGKKQKP